MAVEAADGTRGWLIGVAFSLRAIPMKESTHRLQNQISTACAPYQARQRRWEKRHLWDHEESLLLRLAGAGVGVKTGGSRVGGPELCV